MCERISTLLLLIECPLVRLNSGLALSKKSIEL